MNKRILTIKEAAEYIGMRPNYIRDLIAKQKFPHKNVSRGERAVFRFDKIELDKWLNDLPGMSNDELLV